MVDGWLWYAAHSHIPLSGLSRKGRADSSETFQRILQRSWQISETVKHVMSNSSLWFSAPIETVPLCSWPLNKLCNIDSFECILYGLYIGFYDESVKYVYSRDSTTQTIIQKFNRVIFAVLCSINMAKKWKDNTGCTIYRLQANQAKCLLIGQKQSAQNTRTNQQIMPESKSISFNKYWSNNLDWSDDWKQPNGKCFHHRKPI